MKFKMKFKEYLKLFLEAVSSDCSTGAGVIPNIGPYAGFKVKRTGHLDDVRKNGKERDEGFDCDTFDHIVKGIIKKRPLGLQDGEYSIIWRNDKGYQNAIVGINNKNKLMTFITVMQLNRKPPGDYKPKPGTKMLNLGYIPEPKH